jgi:hypothetical protein
MGRLMPRPRESEHASYTIAGVWPNYRIMCGRIEIHTSSSIPGAMRWLADEIQPGDTITWEKTSR